MPSKQFVVVCFLALSCASMIFGQKASGIRTPAFKAAEARYDRALKDLDREYQRKVVEVRQAYINDLKELQKTATESNNLDEAVRLRDLIRDLESELKIARVALDEDPSGSAAAEALRQQIVGSRWQTKNDVITFHNDGTLQWEYGKPGKDNPRRRWLAADENKVVILYERNLDVFIFDTARNTAQICSLAYDKPYASVTKVK